MNTVLVNLLNISPNILAKTALVEEYICNIWEHNCLQKDTLYKPILEDTQRQAILNLIHPGLTLETTENLSTNTASILTEENIPEIEMPDIQETQRSENIQEHNFSTNEGNSLLSTKNLDEQSNNHPNLNDIREVEKYEMRHRAYSSINPFFITKEGSFVAGALIANTPGEGAPEQLAYLANLLSIPKSELHLINTLFYNGNGWYTIRFDLKEDLHALITKINKKGDEFKFIELEISKSPVKTSKKTKQQDQDQTETTGIHKQSQPKPVINKEKLSLNFQLAPSPGPSQLRIKCATVPGMCRKEQLDSITQATGIALTDEGIEIKNIGTSRWVILHFPNQKENNKCKEILDCCMSDAEIL